MKEAILKLLPKDDGDILWRTVCSCVADRLVERVVTVSDLPTNIDNALHNFAIGYPRYIEENKKYAISQIKLDIWKALQKKFIILKREGK